MLEPLAVDPRRSVVPAANSIASARLVFPAPAGPTSVMTRVPSDCPARLPMCDPPSSGSRAGESLFEEALGRPRGHAPSACFDVLARGERLGSAGVGRGEEQRMTSIA